MGEKKLSMNWLCGGLLSFLVTDIVRIQALGLILLQLDPFVLVSYVKQMERDGGLPKV